MANSRRQKCFVNAAFILILADDFTIYDFFTPRRQPAQHCRHSRVEYFSFLHIVLALPVIVTGQQPQLHYAPPLESCAPQAAQVFAFLRRAVMFSACRPPLSSPSISRMIVEMFRSRIRSRGFIRDGDISYGSHEEGIESLQVSFIADTEEMIRKQVSSPLHRLFRPHSGKPLISSIEDRMRQNVCIERKESGILRKGYAFQIISLDGFRLIGFIAPAEHIRIDTTDMQSHEPLLPRRGSDAAALRR